MKVRKLRPTRHVGNFQVTFYLGPFVKTRSWKYFYLNPLRAQRGRWRIEYHRKEKETRRHDDNMKQYHTYQGHYASAIFDIGLN